MITRYASVLAVALSLNNPVIAAEEKSPDWNAQTLSGDWGGARSSLYKNGIKLEFTHKSDLLANTSGGASRDSAWLMNSEAAISLDLDKLAGWGGTSAFIQYHVQHGDTSINDYTGSFAGVSNIETGNRTGQFYQAWLQKNSSDDKLSLLAGLYAIDSEFYVTDTSGLFLQPPYGMSAEMAQTGQNGPPVFPMGALGIRLKYAGEGYYLQAALTDGVPGKAGNQHGTHIQLDKGDGTLAVAEFGLTPQTEEGSYSKTALGLWRYTTRADDLTEIDALGNPLRRNDRGGYLLAERTLLAEQGKPGQGLSGFIRFGVVNKDVYQADWSGSIGLNYQGLFDGRDEDAAGIAVTNSHAGSKYRQNNGGESSETVVELTYRAQINPWFALQPTLQYIHNPNMDPALEDAWVTGARLEINF